MKGALGVVSVLALALLLLCCAQLVLAQGDAPDPDAPMNSAADEGPVDDGTPGTVDAEGQGPCTADYEKSVFTPCDKTTNKMLAVSYYNGSCNPQDANTIPLRAPRVADCIKPCASGTFYDPDTVDCTKCPKGFMSNSGGRILNTFRGFPSGFTTYCYPQPCSVWKANGVSLSSGNQSDVGGIRYNKRGQPDESVYSELITMIPVINPKGGLLRFLYRVESEFHFDGLALYINSTLAKGAEQNSPYLLTGYHRGWHKFEQHLPPGLTEVRWAYHKDQDQESVYGTDVGADRGFIRDIVIEGVQMFAPTCVPCAAGKYADETASMSCKMCPKNHASALGAASCTPCEGNQWAPPGSARCFDKLDCTHQDYLAEYGACQAGTNGGVSLRNRTWKLINTRCLPQGAPPVPDQVPCAACIPGHYRNEQLECIPCPEGQSLNPTTDSCVPCEAGTAAVRSKEWDGFETLGGNLESVFSTSCEGECSACPTGQSSCTVWGAGFELVSSTSSDADHTRTVIRSDMSNGGEFTTTLGYNFTAEIDGAARLQFHFMRPREGAGARAMDESGYSAHVFFEGEGDGVRLNPSHTSIDHPGFEFLPYKAGNRKLRIQFSQESTHSPQDPVSLVIQSLTLTNDKSGSADSCQKCIAGHYCPAHTPVPIPCPLGTFRSEPFGLDASACSTCPGTTVATKPGSTRCWGCYTGTVANHQHTKCLADCKDMRLFSKIGTHFQFQHYDLSPLKDHVYGPVFPVGTPDDMNRTVADNLNIHRFYVSPCTYVNAGAHDSICRFNNGNDVQDAYSCQRVTQNMSYAAGDEVKFTSNEKGLTATFTGGDVCHRGNEPRSTNLTMLCDPSVDGPGELAFVNEYPHCHYNFVLSTRYACPLCDEESFTKTVGECTPAGQREIVYFKRNPADQCVGGYTPPANANVSCDRCTYPGDYDILWGDCIDGTQRKFAVLKDAKKGCYGEGTKDDLGNRTCTKVDVKLGQNKFSAFLAIVLGCILVLVTSLCVVSLRHRALKHKFARLSNQEPPTNEMHDVPTCLDDDKNNESAVPTQEDP